VTRGGVAVAGRFPDLSLADWAVLGIVAERPTHGWAVARELAADGALGRVWTVPRPVVYRSITTLTARGLVAPTGEAAGGRGPQRMIVRATPRGRAALRRWLDRPVEHVRDVRGAFLVKLALLDRAGRPRDLLVRRQLEALAPVFASTRRRDRRDRGPGGFDAVLASWRRESASAVERFLRSLLDRGT
jgi:PadR family transcriptional regulator AphA